MSPDFESSQVKSITSTTPIGFIGLGAMGSAMAKNLNVDGCDITVWNRSKPPIKEALAGGAKEAATLTDLAANSQIVFTCVTDQTALRSILFGEGGLFAESVKNSRVKVIVDHSTIAPSEAEEISSELLERGVHFIDAPVTGGDIGAKNRTLTIMCGGDPQAIDSVLPFLYRMASNVYYCGPTGFGQRTKAVNQLLTAMSHLGLAEALALTNKLSLDPTLTMEIVGSGAAGSWAITRNGPKVIAGDFAPGFKAKDQLKDLRFALSEAEKQRLELPGLKLLVQRFEELQSQGKGELGNHAVALLYKK